MKKALLILILVFANINYAQDVILTFDGVLEGTSTYAPLDRVTIENLTQGGIIEVNSPYVINLTGALDINDFEQGIAQRGFQKIYPNPMNSSATIEFYSEGVGKTTLNIYNLLGQEIAVFSEEVGEGVHKLKFSPQNEGVYLIALNDNGNSYFSKIIASQNNNSKATLSYLDKQSSEAASKSSSKTATTNSFYNIGDVLRYTGYYGTLTQTIYGTPTQSSTVTFTFSPQYYRFEPHLIKASIPSFVDIMFSVTDADNKGVDYLTDADFKVWEDGSKISPTETFQYVKRLKDIPYFQKTVIMLDNSASVAVNLATIKTAAINLVNKLVPDQEIAIYSFSDNAVLLQDFTTNVTDLEAAINGITTGFPSTNLYGSIITGLDSFTNVYTLDQVEEGYLIALTDGNDTQGSSTLQQVIDARGKKRVFVAGLGSELDPNPLIQIASTGKYFPVTTIVDLDANFNQIWLDIIQYSNSFYWLNYMTPKRTGIHDLIVEIPVNTNTNGDRAIIGTFPADGFQSVFSGVYANITADKLYGVDWVNLADDIFPGNLKATTYWATDVPDYTWSVDNPSIVTANVNSFDNSKMTLSSWSAPSSELATVTLADITNSFTKEIEVFSNSSVASVYTKDIIAITNTSATINCLAVPSKNNNPSIIRRGIYLGLSQNGFSTTHYENFGVGKYSIVATDLIANTTYYTRGIIGTSDSQNRYASEVKSFTTLPGLPYLTNIFDSDYQSGKKTRTSAYLSARIENDGGDTITEKGFVYSTNPNPTLDTATKVINVSLLNANGVFESNITGLTPDIVYYARGYATNSFGTSYTRGELSFTTAPIRVPYVTLGISNSNIFPTSINSDGNVIYDGGSNVIARGICWSTSPNPTVALPTKTSNGTGLGAFTSAMTGLKENTTYYIRAYATNATGTGYSSEVTRITPKQLPILSTSAVSDITRIAATTASVKGGGMIISNGGSTEQGIQGLCWSTSPNPTILDSKTVTGTANPPWGGSFTQNMSLIIGTTYYLRAYATNEIGTGYGNEISFTVVVSPTLSTSVTSDITSTSATSGGTISSAGGGAISERGVCWSTSSNPTIGLTTKTSDGTGIGSYTSAITGLDNFDPGTIFYVRAYATNEAGTSYGNEIKFNTPGLVDYDGNVYSSVIIGGQEWMQSNLNVSHYRNGDVIPQVSDPVEWNGLTTGAWCYYENITENGSVYGKLYNIYAVIDPRGLAPDGWHISNNNDWEVLYGFLGGLSLAGGKLKEQGTDHWQTPNTEATNSSGFAALPGGIRAYQPFSGLGVNAWYWSSTQQASQYYYNFRLSYNNGVIQRSQADQKYGLSVRCVRD